VFDSAGTFLSAFGRQGGEPGEFHNLNQLIIGAGDTLHVAEAIGNTSRVHVFEPQGFTFVRTDEWPWFAEPTASLPRGRYAAVIRMNPAVGATAIWILTLGTLKPIRTFGPVPARTTPESNMRGGRVSASKGGGVVDPARALVIGSGKVPVGTWSFLEGRRIFGTHVDDAGNTTMVLSELELAPSVHR
jgi:hypothetical protein